MKLILDINAKRLEALPDCARPHVVGQLLTPLTGYARWSDNFAIDNGAFTMFRIERFRAILEREKEHKQLCSWVAVPDVPGSARRTLEIWKYRFDMVPGGWPLAYVAQDGSEDIPIPWDDLAAVFIGGTDAWKDGKHAAAIVKTAKTLDKIAHVGRVNSRKRFKHFDKLGADTCDGSGAARYDAVLERMFAASQPQSVLQFGAG